MIKSTADGTRDQRCRAGRRRAWASDERGSATVMVALTVAGLTGLLALGIDLGALYSARSEAQRAADAAALAGASAFLEYQQDQARAVAEVRAMQFATSNAIRGTQIVAEDVTITVVVDSSIVRAHVRRGGVPTWFARIFGVDQVDIAAEATAWAGAAGAAQCVKPFALPDMWDESSQDVNGNRIWDSGERWSYDPSKGDRYARYSGVGGSSTETGYGSSWRNQYADARGRTYAGDYGRRVTVKVTDPRETLTPSFFLPWVLPPDGSQAQCGSTPPGGGRGAAAVTAGAAAVTAGAAAARATTAGLARAATVPAPAMGRARGRVGPNGSTSGKAWADLAVAGITPTVPTVPTVQAATADLETSAGMTERGGALRGIGRTSARATRRSSISTPST